MKPAGCPREAEIEGEACAPPHRCFSLRQRPNHGKEEGKMGWIDWLIVIIPTAFVMGLGMYSKKYVHGVADFLSAGRCAGRYVLSMGDVASALEGENSAFPEGPGMGKSGVESGRTGEICRRTAG